MIRYRCLFANITPNWFASVMGTGIVAVAAVGLPVHFPGQRLFAATVWALAVALLAVWSVATALHWRWFPATARTHHRDPVMAHFYGAPPMALLTVGAATFLVGRDVVGLRLALGLDWVLWGTGTLLGLGTFAAVIWLVVTDRYPVGAPFGGWLMPVVPPMVSAATGALLVPHAPTAIRLSLLLACYAMFGLSLVASAIVITSIARALVRRGPGPARLVPTLWIVLGPLGQSITAANLLGRAAAPVLAPPYAAAAKTFGIAFGLLVWGFAVFAAAIAARITLRTIRAGLPFSLTWWSFTFPIGTVVTGTSALTLATGESPLRDAAVVAFSLLVLAWLIVAARTATALVRGDLLRPPNHRPAPPADAALGRHAIVGG